VARDTVTVTPTRTRHCFNTAGQNKLVCPAFYPRYKCGNLVSGGGKAAQGDVFHLSWALLMFKRQYWESHEPNGLEAKCPVLANLPTLTMQYLHEALWCGSSGGMQVANGGKELPDVNNPLAMLKWLCDYTDGRKHACGPNTPGGIAIFSCLQLAGSSLLRASPHMDHRYEGQPIIGCCVVWVSFSKSKGFQESEVDRFSDEEYMKLLQYGQLECFFSFDSKDAYGKTDTQDMALIRKMHRLEYYDKKCDTVLLATCADTQSNPKGTKMLQVINVQRILADAVLVKHEIGTIPISWKKKMQSNKVPDGITANSGSATDDGSSVWHLPVHVRRSHGPG
jgi:hypothetical protein